MTKTHDESGTWKWAFQYSAVAVVVALFVDVTVELATGYTPTLWVPPLSDSFIPLYGMLFPASPGLLLVSTVAFLWFLRGFDFDE